MTNISETMSFLPLQWKLCRNSQSRLQICICGFWTCGHLLR